MWLINKKRLQEKSLKKRIQEIIEPYGYEITLFVVNYKKEYNILLKLVAKDKINLKFTTINNSIYLNKKLICDNSYHLDGFNDLPFKFIECVELEIKKERTIDFSLKNIKVIFYSNKRKSFPTLTSSIENRAGYRPHLVIKGTTKYLGIEFYRSQLQSFDKYGTASIRLLYDGVDYSALKVGTKFDIFEGRNIVGEGEIIDW
jgi:hypothetical protein